MKTNKKTSNRSFMVMCILLAIYALVYFFNKNIFMKISDQFLKLLLQIFPFLIIVFVLMFLTNLWLKPDIIKKYLGENSGAKGMALASLAGILSVGSVYMWYPLIKDLKVNGMSNKLISVFIYNRAVKLHLLPLMVLYFGITFTIILTVLTIIFSFIIGEIVEVFS
ncbi:putative permease [bacterium BMS3Abin04]|nr:putative permease [bacterium BMS3Abin04]